MKILFAAALAGVYLLMLWGPAYFVARKLQVAGDPAPLRLLRFILPAQVMGTFAFTFMADAAGLRNPAGLLIAFTAGFSVAGAIVCALLGWYRARRGPI